MIESRFINEPFHKIEKALLKYDFVPIKEAEIEDLKKSFVLGGTKILEPHHISPDFLLNVMPTING